MPTLNVYDDALGEPGNQRPNTPLEIYDDFAHDGVQSPMEPRPPPAFDYPYSPGESLPSYGPGGPARPGYLLDRAIEDDFLAEEEVTSALRTATRGNIAQRALRALGRIFSKVPGEVAIAALGAIANTATARHTVKTVLGHLKQHHLKHTSAYKHHQSLPSPGTQGYDSHSAHTRPPREPMDFDWMKDIAANEQAAIDWVKEHPDKGASFCPATTDTVSLSLLALLGAVTALVSGVTAKLAHSHCHVEIDDGNDELQHSPPKGEE